MNTDQFHSLQKHNIQPNHFHRIPNIVPIRKMPTAIPKVESNMAIRCQVRMREQYENKFETDQEIQTEEECGRVSMSDSQDYLCRKNSFVHHPNSNKNKDKKCKQQKGYQNNQISNNCNRLLSKKTPMHSTSHSHPHRHHKQSEPILINQQQQNSGFFTILTNEPPKQKKQLSVYHCDSLCIRPNPPKHHPALKQYSTASESLSNQVYKSQHIFNGSQHHADSNQHSVQQSRILNNNDCFERICEELENQKQENKKYEENMKKYEENMHMEIPQISIYKHQQMQRHAGSGSRKSKGKKMGIFYSKISTNAQILNKKTKIQHLQQQIQSHYQQEPNKWSRQEMHIVFETDQITQCCL